MEDEKAKRKGRKAAGDGTTMDGIGGEECERGEKRGADGTQIGREEPEISANTTADHSSARTCVCVCAQCRFGIIIITSSL